MRFKPIHSLGILVVLIVLLCMFRGQYEGFSNTTTKVAFFIHKDILKKSTTYTLVNNTNTQNSDPTITSNLKTDNTLEITFPSGYKLNEYTIYNYDTRQRKWILAKFDQTSPSDPQLMYKNKPYSNSKKQFNKLPIEFTQTHNKIIINNLTANFTSTLGKAAVESNIDVVSGVKGISNANIAIVLSVKK